MMKPVVCGALAVALAAGPGMAQTRVKAPAAAASKSLADYSEAMENLSEAASPAVVQILVQGVAAVGQGESKRMGFVSEQEATGSGVIVDPTGYIITNAHVVQNARRINVKVMRVDEKNQTPHGHMLPAKLIGLDTQVDIAVLKIEGTNLPTLSFMNSDTLRQGRLVMALGSPLGLQNTLTHGVVSATLRQLKPESPMVYIQTDAPINPGNSGGPLLDIEGRIVGINTMIYTESGGNEGIGFAIPANLAKDVYLKLRKDGRVRRGAIGVLPETITPALATGLGLDRDSGVILSDVAPHGAADAAGLQPGDVLVSIDGKPIKEVRDLALTVFQRAPGDELKIVVQRGKEEITKTVAVLERKNEPSLLADQANYQEALVRELGILAVTVDEKVTAVLPDLRRLSGVAVAAVPTEFAGLNPGLLAGDVIYEVNTKGVASLDELKAVLKEKKPGESIVLLVERMGQLIYVTATLE